MKITYQKLEHQTRAVESVVGLFDGGHNVFGGRFDETVFNAQEVVQNKLEFDEARILANIKRIQKENGIVGDSIFGNILGRDFSVEMETGTGKTYVYIKTILTLAQKYGLSKFIILVPSVAIREGVQKSLRDLRAHLTSECGLPQYSAFTYDSGRLGEVRSFATTPGVAIMVTTIQSFNKDTNTLRRKDLDSFYGGVPIEIIAQTRPVIVMDEPQNMESELSRSAIGELNALFRLRYSATHKEKYNLVYSLDPMEAYKKRLVKRIDVIGVTDYGAQDFVFEVRKIKAQARQPLKAWTLIEIKKPNGEFQLREVVLKKLDDLYRKTKKNEKYAGLRVGEIDAVSGCVELSNQEKFCITDNKDNKEAIFRAQIRETIKTHMDKQAQMSDVKVLSLFFIDKVDNYIHEDSLIRQIFQEEFDALKLNYEFFAGQNASEVHSGYFTKKGKTSSEAIDTSGKTAKDKDTFALIMREKERLLSFGESVSFIFSHSALREGWDNPNIFQICTLQETRSENDKRQKIGRGLRLPVNRDGARIEDDSRNILTVIANESYEQYVRELQTEYSVNGQKSIAPPARKPGKVRVKKELLAQAEFLALWDKIKHKTRMTVEFDSEQLVANVVDRFDKQVEDVASLAITVNRVRLGVDDQNNFRTIFQSSEPVTDIDRNINIFDVARSVAEETGVTKKTIYNILERLADVEKLDLIFENPEEFAQTLCLIIRACLDDIVINDGLVYTKTGEFYDVSIFKNFEANLTEVVVCEKSLFDKVVCDSEGERIFAQNLDTRDDLKLFVKLPNAFKIDTPMGGTYNPDWAIVLECDGQEKLYLVRETKFAKNKTKAEVLAGLRVDEMRKIKCGEKHFQTLGVDFAVAVQDDLSDLKL